MYPSSLHIIYMIIILSCINALYVLLSYTFCFDVLAFLFFHALSISVQDQWSFTNLRACFFFGGGQDGPTTTTTPGHGNRWVHCMVPWRPMSRMPCCNPVRVGARWAGGSLGRKGWPGWRKGCWIIECHELEGLQQIGWVWRWIFQDQLCYFGDFLRFFCDSCGKGIMRDLLRKIDASRV